MTKRKPPSEVRKIAPGIEEKISRRSGVTHSLTEIFSNASPSDANRVISESGPLGFVNEVRERVERSERFLHDQKLGITLADDAPTPTHLEVLERMKELGYGPLKDETISVQIVLSGKAILRAPREHESLILQAISYGMATFEQDHFAETSKAASESATQKRNVADVAAVAAWRDKSPGRSARERFNNLPKHKKEKPNVGESWIWREGDKFVICHPESGQGKPKSFRTFERYFSKAKNN